MAHDHKWVATDPTGGDPFMGGPVSLTVCSECGVERPDRPSAVTPEEVLLLAGFLDELDASGHTAEVLAHGDRSPFSESELLDLIRRAQAAQRETDAVLAEGMALAEHLTREDEAHNFGVRLAAAAIRAGE